MKYTILILFLLVNGFLFAQKSDSLKLSQIYHKVDSTKYSKSDFVKMQRYFNENSKFKTVISKKAEQGDKNAADLLDILDLSYEKVNEKYGTSTIKGMIHTYNISIAIQKKFDEVNSKLDMKLENLILDEEY